MLSGFQTKILYAFFIFLCVLHSPHLILINLITTIFGEE